MCKKLRQRIDRVIEQLDDVPKMMLARALVAKACDMSLDEQGMLATTWLTQRASDLLSGHWSPESIEVYIATPNR
jgi:hypothetical protein